MEKRFLPIPNGNTTERRENGLRGHSADNEVRECRKLAHPTRFERVTFAFGDFPANPLPIDREKRFATPPKTLFASMIANASVCQSKLLILQGRGITSLSAISN